MLHDLAVDARHVIPSRELAFVAVRASGPGGQNVNKVSSKVELRFDLPGSIAFSAEEKARIVNLAKNKLDAEGKIVVVSQKTRDQARNVEDALEKLAELLRAGLFVPKRRKKTRPGRGAIERRLGEKRHRSDTKATRRGGFD
ncbi:MAG: alternative ribosome rescue aminoacyl-tRNA hydrolase ArfB [Polyangiaceae bacterium]